MQNTYCSRPEGAFRALNRCRCVREKQEACGLQKLTSRELPAKAEVRA